VLLAAGIALVAASARAESGQVVLAPTVSASHDLPANAITAFTVSCRAGYVAASGGIANPAPGTTVLAITPAGLRAYRFRIGNPVMNGDQRVTVAVACRKLTVAGTGPKLTLSLLELRPKRVVVPPRKPASATLDCPAGTVPAGSGFDLDPMRAKEADAYRGGSPLQVRRDTANLRRFFLSVQNGGSRPRAVAFYGSCVTVTREAGAPQALLHIDVSTFRIPLQPGRRLATRRCRAGWFPLAAGFSLRASTTQLTGAVAARGGGRWLLSSDAIAPTTADLQLACGRVGS
jgi:hypothetical protein